MKKCTSFFVILFLIINLFSSQTSNVSAETTYINESKVVEFNQVPSVYSESITQVENSYIVTFQPGISIGQMRTIIKQYGGKIHDDRFNSQMAKIHLPKEQYQKVKSDQDVKFIEKNQPFKTLGFGSLKQYSHQRTQVSNAWDQGLKGEGIDIAILDTGIAPHEDLNIVGGYSAVSYTDSYFDDNGHGTHVAGIVSSKDNGIGTTGVASEANIYSVKVLNYTGTGELMDVIDGIDWSIKKGVDIINISLGTTTGTNSPSLKAKIDEARAKGIIVVAAAGNTGDTNIAYPAKYNDVIAVGATNENDRLSSFSSRGSELDIVAPGKGIISTYLGDLYANANGTSQAAPYVSGALALLKEKYPNNSTDELVQTLYAHALDLGVKGKDPLYGHGLVQFPNTDKVSNDDLKEGSTNKKDSSKDKISYKDVKPGDSHYHGIKWLSERGIQGYPNGNFGVWQELNRRHAAVMFAKALNLEIPSAESVEDYFNDVSPNHMYAELIAATGKAGIFEGSNREFLPNENVTREQMASTLVRAYNLKSTEKPVEINLKNVDESHRKNVQILADLGITNQHRDFRPHEFITRGQFATFLYRASKIPTP